jgi:hypothetical protein
VAVLRLVARILGWLLTPAVALAASFLGATLAAAVFVNEPPREALILSLTGAALSAVTVSWLWFRLLRRSPQVREALALDEEGLPTVPTLEELTGPPLPPSVAKPADEAAPGPDETPRP